MPHLEEIIVVKKTILILTIFGLKTTQSLHRIVRHVDDGHGYNSFNDYDEGFTIHTSGCSIPRMKVDDYSIKNFTHYHWQVNSCPHSKHPLLQSNQTHIWTVDENFEYYNIDDQSKFKCCYKSFHRSLHPPLKRHRTLNNTKDVVVYLDCIMFDDIIEAANEFVKVECYYGDKIIHNQFFVFIPKKALNDKREYPFKLANDKPSFNVLIMGLRSMSRLNFQRTMPNTHNLLEDLGAIGLLGYHTVGNSTLSNIMPILAGMTHYEMRISCLPFNKTVFDSCPFLWERFKDFGYYTALVEDTAKTGIFNSDVFGFSGSPTDYYLHPFIQEAENIEPLPKHNSTAKVVKRFLQLWKKPKTLVKPTNNESICMGNRYAYRLILEYIDRLTSILGTSRLFGFFWESSFSQHLNAGKLMDFGYERLIKKLNDTGYLNKTILIMVSDHGMGKGDIEETKQGRLEQRLPLAAILLPPKFRELYSVAYESLKINSYRLSTPFDLHETLIDLIDMNAIDNYEVLNRNRSKSMYQRGMSLFVPIQSNRTCESSSIGSFWCTCHKKTRINVKSLLVRGAVGFLMSYLNSMLKLYPNCVQLGVDEVIKVEEMWPSYAKELEWREFKVVIRLKPGAREYEALLRHDDEGWSLMAHIRKLNDNHQTEHRHGMHDELIKWYCE